MAKIYHTQSPIWWNTGNEVKPNSSAFQKLVFVEATNFNISWLSETTIHVIVPSNKITTMIKIEETEIGEDRYFYLLEITNRTKTNMECIFELDVWCTYLLPVFPEIKTIRTLDANLLSPNINIEPVGVPTGNIISQKIAFENTNLPETLLRPFPQDIPYDNMQAYAGITTNIYYVFKTRFPNDNEPMEDIYKFKNFIPELPNYILVPLLNLADYGISKEYEVFYYRLNEPVSPDSPANHYKLNIPGEILNNRINIDYLVQNYTQLANHGVGEFIGIWLGPNYFRLKNKGIAVGQYNFGRAWNRGLVGTDLPKVITQDILVDYTQGPGKYLKNKHYGGQGTYLALRMTALPLEMVPLSANFDKNELLKGLKFQENNDNHLIINSNQMFFNQCFNYSNGLETTTIDINIPYSYDSYYNTLAAQRNTMNTSLALSGANSVIQGLSAAIGLIPPAPKTSIETRNKQNVFAPQMISRNKKRILGKKGEIKNMGWAENVPYQNFNPINTTDTITKTTPSFGLGNFVSGAMGLVNAGMQFISTLADQNAYRRDLRLQLSSTVLNVNDKYVAWHRIVSQYQSIGNMSGNHIDLIITALSYEILSGAEVEPGISYKFYGIESQPIPITDLYANDEYYIQIDDNTALSLQNQWGSQYTPIIKEAMLTLLKNGIRLTGGKIK